MFKIKNYIKIILVLLISITMVMGTPVISMAEESLSIPKWLVESNLLENGDLEVVEDLTFRFNEKYNGVFREIVLEGTSGIEGVRVVENSNNNVLEYRRVEKAKKGDRNVFLVKEEKNNMVLQIFSPSKDEEKTFRIIYTVKNVAKKYNDIGELYYQFLGNENETPIGLFSVNITLPSEDVNNEVKVFGHGPLHGQIHKTSNNRVNLRIENVPENTFIEGRILFPKEFIHASQNIVNKDGYSDIMNEEAHLQEKIQESIAKRKARSALFGNVATVFAVIQVLIFIIFFMKFRRPKDIYGDTKYFERPEDNTPAVVSYTIGTLMNNNTIIATILDLYRRGYLKVDNGEEFKKNKEILKEFTITKVKEEDNNLLDHEKHFITWLIEYMGDGETVTTKDIENYSKKQSSNFTNHYTKWHQLIKDDANKKGYFDSSTRKYGFSLVILFIIGFILSIVPLVYENLLGLTLMATSLLILILGIMLLSRKSEYGYDQHRKWQEFIRSMKKLKKDGSIHNLDKYPKDMVLIYGLALGIDTKVLDKFNIEPDHAGGTFAYSHGWIYWYFLLNNNKNNAFNQSINHSFSGSATSVGGGGGFTAGGGGGAGGGGAGGF